MGSDAERSVTVRPATEADFEPWFALFEEVAAEGRWIGAEAPLHRGWAERTYPRGLDGERATTLLAELPGRDDDGLLVGHLSVTLTGGVGEVGMMVRAGHRQRGVGSALLTAAIDWCRERGAHKVTLSVWPHNAAAIALYEAHGFVVEGRLVGHVRRANGELWDLVPMGLLLETEPADRDR